MTQTNDTGFLNVALSISRWKKCSKLLKNRSSHNQFQTTQK